MIDRTSEFVFSPEVGAARLAGAPLVALESTLISHGLPHPDNIEVARGAEAAGCWRAAGARHRAVTRPAATRTSTIETRV